jgi:hypothetical protein
MGMESEPDRETFKRTTWRSVERRDYGGEWRREGDSNRLQTNNRINNLLIRKTMLSPPIPRNRYSCHQSCHQESLSVARFLTYRSANLTRSLGALQDFRS